jgi:hypothetical protein
MMRPMMIHLGDFKEEMLLIRVTAHCCLVRLA